MGSGGGCCGGKAGKQDTRYKAHGESMIGRSKEWKRLRKPGRRRRRRIGKIFGTEHFGSRR